MQRTVRSALYVVAGSAWAAVFAVGGWRLWEYDSRPGVAAQAPAVWPVQSQIPRKVGLPILVLLMHPHCPCSGATVEELSRLMTECNGKLQAYVLLLRPQDQAPGWERTDLWKSSAAIPGVNVIADDDGRESRLFGAATSGQAILYAANGRLLFSGGITESRGHSGDNAGQSAIVSLVSTANSRLGEPALHTPVYGCPLFDDSEACQIKGEQACPK